MALAVQAVPEALARAGLPFFAATAKMEMTREMKMKMQMDGGG